MRVGDTETTTKGRSRSYSSLEATCSDHILNLKTSKTSSSSSSSRSMMMNINIDDLPDVVLVEILSRLPCNKLAFQCKCVCKRWCTLISNPYFIRRFLCLQIDKQTPIKVTLINPKGEEIHTRMSSPVFKRLMSVHGLKEEPIVIGTYNDLVLCCATKYYQRDYYICNPYTAQWVALPPASPTQSKWPVAAGFICDIPYYNYNQDDARKGSYNVQLNAEYRCKVVRFLPNEEYDEKYGSYKLTLELFCFETGEWRVLVVLAPLSFANIDDRFSFTYNGVLYWWDEIKTYGFPCLMGLDPFMININSTSTSSSNGDDVIDYYKCHVLKFLDPAVSIDDSTDECEISTVEFLGVCGGGCVRICDFNLHLRTLLVYELKEEEDAHDQMAVDGVSKFCLERTSVYLLDRKMIPDDFGTAVDLIAFDPNNEDILYLHVDGGVVMCNIRTRKWLNLAAAESKLHINGCFFKIVLPWWPTPVPRLPQHVSMISYPMVGGISS